MNSVDDLSYVELLRDEVRTVVGATVSLTESSVEVSMPVPDFQTGAVSDTRVLVIRPIRDTSFGTFSRVEIRGIPRSEAHTLRLLGDVALRTHDDHRMSMVCMDSTSRRAIAIERLEGPTLLVEGGGHRLRDAIGRVLHTRIVIDGYAEAARIERELGRSPEALRRVAAILDVIERSSIIAPDVSKP